MSAKNNLRGITLDIGTVLRIHSLTLIISCLRAIDRKYGESSDRSENSDLLLLRQKDFFGELFSEIHLKSSCELTIFLKSTKVRNTTPSTKTAYEIYAKLYIFNRPVQKEGNLPRFRIHAVCNLNFYHSSELKVILKEVRFVYFSAI